jgi:hypothetical protein
MMAMLRPKHVEGTLLSDRLFVFVKLEIVLLNFV